MKRSQVRAPAPPNLLLPHILRSAIGALRDAEGRAGGLRFNKLVYALQRELNKSKNKSLHVSVPYRWYLHGAVVDDFSLRNYVEIDHPEDEYASNVRWIGGKLSPLPEGYEGGRDEIERVCRSFVRQYEGHEGIAPMLRAHYEDAPLEFQRRFLEWSLNSREVFEGYASDAPDRLSKVFAGLAEEFPRDFETRLSPSFERLILFLEPILRERAPGNLKDLKTAWLGTWDFWCTFCLFLSLKHHEGLSPQRLASFQNRAETELVAYKRRLNAFLEHGYLEEQKAAGLGAETADPLRKFLYSEVLKEIEGGA